MNWIFPLVLGVVFIDIGLFIALRPLFTHGAVLMGARWLDMIVALVALLRGMLNVKRAIRLRVATRAPHTS
jgi:hypothetical protein